MLPRIHYLKERNFRGRPNTKTNGFPAFVMMIKIVGFQFYVIIFRLNLVCRFDILFAHTHANFHTQKMYQEKLPFFHSVIQFIFISRGKEKKEKIIMTSKNINKLIYEIPLARKFDIHE